MCVSERRFVHSAAPFNNFPPAQALLRHELGQSILRNILPMPVADQLMENLALSCRINIAHDYSMATVAFCDIVGVCLARVRPSPT